MSDIIVRDVTLSKQSKKNTYGIYESQDKDIIIYVRGSNAQNLRVTVEPN